MADEIVELNDGTDNLVIVGIQRRGVQLAKQICTLIEEREGARILQGSLDITLYRDDLRLRGTRALGRTDVPPEGIDDKRVILVDDVLFSGRTIRAALNAIADLGRPRQVQLSVLVDRGHRELPIKADYVGKNIPTSRQESVQVRLHEIDGGDEVVLQSEE